MGRSWGCLVFAIALAISFKAWSDPPSNGWWWNPSEPGRGYAIHDAILNGNGLGLFTRMMSLAAAPSGVAVARLEPGTSLEL